MSTAGIYAEVIDAAGASRQCLIIGDGVPRMHHSDGVPVFVVIEGETMDAATWERFERRAYPAEAITSGAYRDFAPICRRHIVARHEWLGWAGRVPVIEETHGFA